MTNIRFDSVKLPKVKKTKEGYLRGDSIVTRTGVFSYMNSDGSIRKELRHPDDVFKQDSLETLKMIPITDDHPPVFVDANNASEYSKGYTGEKYDIVDSKHITVNLTVTHQNLIDKIMLGEKPEISMGYTVDLIPEKGVYDNEEYDFRQTNIKYNHLASVNQGRAGRDARFRFDNACINTNCISKSPTILITTNNLNEAKMTDDIDSSSFELRLDAMNAQVKERETKITLLNSEIEQSKLKTDALEKANTVLKQQIEELTKRTDSKVISQQVIDRVNILASASAYIDPIAYLYHTDREIMISAINAKQKTNDNFEGVDDAYLKGRFDALFNREIQQKINPNVFSVISHHTDHRHSNDHNDDMITKHIEMQRKLGII